MIAIRANYDHGRITLIEPMPDHVKKAKLTIVINDMI